MSETTFFRIRIYITVVITLAIGSLLTWNHFHGGIPSHHILANKDLPKFSNLWGAVLLPLLTWFLLYRVQKRIFHTQHNVELIEIKRPLYVFVFSLLYGIALSAFFSFDYPDMTGNMMLGIFLIALFFPVYRSECLLGFVLGMTFTFGAVLPTGIGTIVALISFILFRGVRPAFLYLVSRLNKA